MSPSNVVLLPGDGIGPEIVAEAVRVLEAVGGIAFETHLIGGASIDAYAVPLADEVLNACRGADAVLLGAVGGPKWSPTDPSQPRPEQGLLDLRRGLDLFANLRPVRTTAALAPSSPLRAELVSGVDILIVRELTGGIYFGAKTRDGDSSASDLCVYTRAEIERIGRIGFEIAAQRDRRVTSVDKANVLETSRLWRAVMDEIAVDYPGVRL